MTPDDVPRSAGRAFHSGATRLMSFLMLVIGVAFIVRLATGAGVFAGVLGVLFLAGGAGRLYVLGRQERSG